MKRCMTCCSIVLILILCRVNSVYCEEGVTDTEVHIAQFGPMTGPAKLWGVTLTGAEIVFEKLNEEGGIHGRKVVYHKVDDSYNPAKTKAGVKRIQEGTGIFAWVGGVGTANGKAVMNYFVKNNIPWVGPFSGSEDFVVPPKRNIFGVFMRYSVSAEILNNYAVDEMGKQKIGMIYLNDSFGVSGLNAFENAMKKKNMQLVSTQSIDIKGTNIQSAVLEMKKASPEAVILWTDPFKALRVLAISKKMNFKPQWISSQMLGDFQSMHAVSRGLIEGLITTATIDIEGKSLKKKYQDIIKKEKYRNAKWTAGLVGGMIHGEVLIEGLKKCGPELTRDNFIKALETIDTFTIGNDLPISYKPFDENDMECRDGRYKHKNVSIQQCIENGKAKILSGWLIQ